MSLHEDSRRAHSIKSNVRQKVGRLVLQARTLPSTDQEIEDLQKRYQEVHECVKANPDLFTNTTQITSGLAEVATLLATRRPDRSDTPLTPVAAPPSVAVHMPTTPSSEGISSAEASRPLSPIASPLHSFISHDQTRLVPRDAIPAEGRAQTAPRVIPGDVSVPAAVSYLVQQFSSLFAHDMLVRLAQLMSEGKNAEVFMGLAQTRILQELWLFHRIQDMDRRAQPIGRTSA